MLQLWTAPSRLKSGTVKYVDAGKIIIDDLTYETLKFARTSPYGTCYNHRVLVDVGDKVKKGEIIADGPATFEGELSIGRNLLVAYASIDGLGYEDSF